MSAGPLLLGLLQVSECCPGVAGLLCARAVLAHLPAFLVPWPRRCCNCRAWHVFSLRWQIRYEQAGALRAIVCRGGSTCADVGGRVRGCVPGDGPLAYATSALLWDRGPCFLRLGVVLSTGPLILSLVQDSGGLSWTERAALRPGGGTRRSLCIRRFLIGSGMGSGSTLS